MRRNTVSGSDEQHATRPLIEGLEDRRLLSVSVSTGGSVIGTPVGPAPISPPIVLSSPITGLTFDAVAGKPFSGEVATWRQAPLANPVNMHVAATIAWGDGSSSAGTIVYGASTLGIANIDGIHTYAKAGAYPTTISITETPIGTPGQPVPLYILLIPPGHGEALVSVPGQLTIHPTVDQLFSGIVAQLNFRVSNSGAGVYAASINWGDGTAASTGTFVSPTAAGNSDVSGSHTYAKAGTYKIVVTVTYGPKPGSGAEFPSRIVEVADSVAVVTGPVATPLPA